MFFVDNGVSGTTFQRPSFQRMGRMAENGEIGTIIVKDLSRFRGKQVETGRLTQVVYPSLGIRFIAIQERVYTLTGDGVEMMPFHNIFNAWYTAQTSKKIHAVWQSKADNGKRSLLCEGGYLLHGSGDLDSLKIAARQKITNHSAAAQTALPLVCAIKNNLGRGCPLKVRLFMRSSFMAATHIFMQPKD